MVEIVGNLYELDGTSKVFQRASIYHADSDLYQSSAHAQIGKLMERLKYMLILKLVLVLIQMKSASDADADVDEGVRYNSP